MKLKALGLSAVAAASLFTATTAFAAEVDPWEKAAEDYLANKPKEEVVKPKEETAKPKEEVAKPKDEAKKPVIDEEYVRQNIDTPTGKEEKAREDVYLDKAEAKYKEELKKQDAAKKAQPEGKGKPVPKVLPKTSAVK
jgi:P-type ATPase4, putative